MNDSTPLFHMRPSLSGYDSFCGGVINPVVQSQNSRGSPFGPSLPHLTDHIICHFGIISSLSSLRFFGMLSSPASVSSGKPFRVRESSIPIFIPHVTHVLCVRSSSDVIRVAEGRVVALVKCFKAACYWAIGQRPRNSARIKKTVPYSKHSVSRFRERRCPNPARSKLFPNNWTVFVNLGPETVLVFLRQFRDWFCSHIANSISFLVSVFRWLQPQANAIFIMGKHR